jgi:hypothetical protein
MMALMSVTRILDIQGLEEIDDLVCGNDLLTLGYQYQSCERALPLKDSKLERGGARKSARARHEPKRFHPRRSACLRYATPLHNGSFLFLP